MNNRFVRNIEKELITGTRHNKKSIEKIAFSYGLYDKNLIKELTELAIVNVCRKISENTTPGDYRTFCDIAGIYKKQANLSHRTSKSMMFQQYSTPAPIAYIAGAFLIKHHEKLNLWKKEKMNYKPAGDFPLCFEPSAGNGLLAIALPYKTTYVNEVDPVRLENLKTQPFCKITSQDATKPFNGYYRKFDCIITNPPFGTLSGPVYYDGYPVKTLDQLMALRALDTMKNDGSAAIIIGGHTSWDEKGRIQAGKNRIFFNYLYSHYYVSDVILIDGHSLYSKQGTAFDVRLILINGRKPMVNGVAPLKNYKLAQIIYDFDSLYNRVMNDNDKYLEIFKDPLFFKLENAKAKMLSLHNL